MEGEAETLRLCGAPPRGSAWTWEMDQVDMWVAEVQSTEERVESSRPEGKWAPGGGGEGA